MDVRGITWQPRSQRCIDVARSLRRPTLAKLDWSFYGNHVSRQGNGGTAEDVYVLHSRQCSTRVKARNLVRQGTGYTEAGPNVAIPVGYQGWFRILHPPTEANLSFHTQTSGCKNIAELFNQPGVTALLSCTDITGFQARTQGGDFQQKHFPPGCVFTIEGAYREKLSNYLCCTAFRKHSRQSSIKYLKCYFGSTSEVLIPMDCKGVFRPLGHLENIQEGCVYQIQQLMDVVRETPGYVVELVHGKPPPKHEQFSKVLRLEDVMKQEVIVACRIPEKVVQGKHPTLLEFPVHSLVAFYLATNGLDQKVVKETLDFVSMNLGQYMKCMKVITTMVFKSLSRPKGKHESPRNVTQDDDTSYWSDTFTDYDTIPCDDPAYDPVYENDDSNFLQQTAQRLREELAKRAAQLAEEGGYTPPYAICGNKLVQSVRKCEDVEDSRLDSFLVTTLDEMNKTTNRTGEPAIENHEDMEEFLEGMFDCDVMSSSTHSGAVLVAQDEEPNHRDDVSEAGPDNPHSSISSLYKKVKRPTNARRSDSGFSDVLRCSACATGSDVTAWQPPKDLRAMSVEEVCKTLKYIGLRTELVTRFMEEQIDGCQLQDIGEDLLREAFPQMNRLDIKKLMDFKAGWRPKRDHQ